MNSSLSAIIVRVLLLCALIALSSGYYLAIESPEELGWRAAKKSQLRALAGSRNCFFSPINCVITHDVSTYRKLAGSS
ncbi:hypothetical protein OESDEN_21046 [Oesophagostomum dentatum]|uniref:Uncharacterized protein n=1 Tax=Oesophagostomum dentatum TaxID=61180 RepID=A0A0B1S2Y8_OESDE|nr:hypothetical protein OESDEN_21046 [Oesophagostomum dentatum]